MVLEHIIPDKFKSYKFSYFFILGLFYTILSIVISKVIFSNNIGFASVAILSILMIPTMRKMFLLQEKKEEKNFDLNIFKILKDNRKIIISYLGFFVGVFLVFFMYSSFYGASPNDVNGIFQEQISVDKVISEGINGNLDSELNLDSEASFSQIFKTFESILKNNWWVVLACFLLSIIAGNGAIFFISWNASVWGVIFGIRALTASIVLEYSFFVNAIMLFICVLPFMLFEILAYIFAGTSGAIISRDVFSDLKSKNKFIIYFLGVICIFILLNLIAKLFYFPGLILLEMLLLLLSIYFLKFTFSDLKHRKIFMYNYIFLIVAAIMLIIGSGIEAVILLKSAALEKIYTASYLFFI